MAHNKHIHLTISKALVKQKKTPYCGIRNCNHYRYIVSRDTYAMAYEVRTHEDIAMRNHAGCVTLSGCG